MDFHSARSSPEVGSTKKPPRILVVDDESFIREAIEVFLRSEGFEVDPAEGGERALSLLDQEIFDVALLDILMPGMDGITLLGEIKKLRPDVEVVMASGCGTIETAVQAMKMGAYDYVSKPILNFEEDLLKVILKALERRRLLSTNRKLATDVQEVNRELKRSNGELKRHLAAFDVLYETGRLLSELNDLESVLDLATGTLEYQLEIAHALLYRNGPRGFRLVRSVGTPPPGPDAGKDSGTGLELLDPDEDKPLEQAQRSRIHDLFATLGGTLPDESDLVAVPLRAGGELQGVLVVALPRREAGEREALLRRLRVLASQLAAPLALFREQVAL